MKQDDLIRVAWMGRKEWKPQDVFDICFDRFCTTRGSRFDSGCLLEKCRVQGMSGPKSRPDVAPRLEEYRADFVLAGWKALNRRNWEKRRALFQTFFVEAVPYKETLHSLRIPKGTADWWMFQIRRSVGFELVRRGLFPPPRYFSDWQISYVETTEPVHQPGSAGSGLAAAPGSEAQAGHERRLAGRCGTSAPATQGA